MRFDRRQTGPNEVFTGNGDPHSHYGPVLEEIQDMGPEEWERG
jgi:hypothetical protein